ncbi:MAG: hypothetical protein BroJett042_25260 [Bacteroidota bacterium]|nr:MAG: hypothetical protein BroJett042_25260 [Bacteroidota bacterium]
MIPHDLTQSIKVSLKTATGQLGYILSKIDDVDQVENILLQLKAVQSMLAKTTYELLDDAYRKALAERISSAYQSCPGDCGNEETIKKLRTLFPELKLEEVTEKLREARMVEEELKKFLSERLDTPSPRD